MEEIIIILTGLFHWDLSGLYCTALFVGYNAISSDTEHTKPLCRLEDSHCPTAERGGTAAWMGGEKRKQSWHVKSHKEAGEGPCRLVIVREK